MNKPTVKPAEDKWMPRYFADTDASIHKSNLGLRKIMEEIKRIAKAGK